MSSIFRLALLVPLAPHPALETFAVSFRGAIVWGFMTLLYLIIVSGPALIVTTLIFGLCYRLGWRKRESLAQDFSFLRYPSVRVLIAVLLLLSSLYWTGELFWRAGIKPHLP